MAIETIEFGGERYPAFQASGHASRFVQSFALEVCQGYGLDVGCGKKEWALPGSIPIDKSLDDGKWDAENLPSEYVRWSEDRKHFDHCTKNYDYIFSSHCLEHVPNWVNALNHWTSFLRIGGVLFLYLPHPSQRYWLPWHNRKHVNVFYPEVITQYMKDAGYRNIFASERDLNHSFAVFGERGR